MTGTEQGPQREREWTPQHRSYAWRYLEVCREVHRLVPEQEAWTLLREYGPLARTSVAAVERAWAREKLKRGLASGTP